MRHRKVLAALLAVLPLALLCLVGPGAPAGVGVGTARAGDQYCDPLGYAPGSCAARRFGRYCRGEPNRRVRGMRGTPWTVCVRAMQRLKHNRRLTPSQACRAEPRRRLRGMRKTPFRICVDGGRRLRARR